MASKLSKELSKLIHQMGREWEERMDDNWKVFEEHREVIGSGGL